ncbi:MAG: exo-alpha-sialidase, partial [Kiritimatiellaeota bacterium]|nr:exo-alpha-sialidase [Kiritimatiellota bacterium]
MKAIGLKISGLGVAAAMLGAVASAPAAELELLRVARISGDAKHCAFTALARFNSAFYCAWREGASHVSADGKLRVVRSADGTNWTSVALM